MGVMNAVKEGADLTHPKASVSWVVGAVVAVVILAFVAAIGMMVYKKGKAMIEQKTGTITPSQVTLSDQSGMGAGEGSGWL